jgi:hypothetical protein
MGRQEGNAALTALLFIFLLIIIIFILTSMGLSLATIISEFRKFFGFTGIGGMHG